MSQQNLTLRPDGSISPRDWYKTASELPDFVYDAAQAAAIEVLDELWYQLMHFKNKRNRFLGRSLLSPEVPNGLYLWGGVGRGKTFLMDAFYNCLPYRRKRRIHFHNFMSEVHHEMKLLAEKNDPLIVLADNIAKSTRVLCLDEFHVDDIADAMILGRLVAAILDRGVVVLTTSNYAPDGLYPHGLQRKNFLPAIELLKSKLTVLNVDGGNDYRMLTDSREPATRAANPHRSGLAMRPDGTQSPREWYKSASELPDFIFDKAQAAAIDALDELWYLLMKFKTRRNQFLGRSLLSPEVPEGLYLWGGVGRGKTFLMDAFYNCLPYRRKRRIHFDEFMAEVQLALLANQPDPLLALAEKIADSSRVLCLDQVHANPQTDPAILGRLFTLMLERGVVLLTTSIDPPDELYPAGLQRQIFLPASELLKQKLKVLNVDGGNNYRKRELIREQLYLVAAGMDQAIMARMDALFEKFAAGKQCGGTHIMIQGRQIPVIKVAHAVVWFDFKELCCGAHAQEDYLEIAYRYPTVFLSHIPKMAAEQAAEARRFTWLVDVFYDNHVRLMASAQAPAEELCSTAMATGEFARTASRLAEMQSSHYQELPHRSQGVKL